ncbi:MAG: hypothetical protein JNM56_24055 [Planctomycetia bacterium]|nr:hypothetical protein [Planctomycetia bacterium]
MQRATFRAGVLAGLLALLLCSLPATSADVPPGVDKDAVAQAIERGVAYLKENQNKNGSWPYHRNGFGGGGLRIGGVEQKGVTDHFSAMDVGVTALAGLALLEADVKPDDPVIQKAADYLRKALPELTWTHSLGAAVLFFDRLNNGQDSEHVKTMAARLVAGQNKDGGWGYSCPKLADSDVRKLNHTNESQYLQGLAKLTKAAAAQQMNGGGGIGGFGGIGGVSMTEQSCSEFAIQALWVARRHQVPVVYTMTTYEKMCRANQNADGSFPYGTRNGLGGASFTTPCMTGAGLLGLLTCHGSANEVALVKYSKSKAGAQPAPGKGLRDLAKDPAVVKGFAALEKLMLEDAKPKDPRQKQPAAGNFGFVGIAANKWEANSTFVYMALWSVERVAVAFDKEKIGKIDWYEWGAKKLLTWQDKEGYWASGQQTVYLDTAFALLFLRRAQPVPDLYLTLKGVLPPPREPSSSSSTSTPSNDK